MQALIDSNAPPELIEKERQKTVCYGVLEENWQAVLLLMKVQACWRVGHSGGLLGLRYTDVDIILKRCFEDDNRVFEQLLFLERVILNGQ